MATANSKLKIDHGFDSFGSSNVTGDFRVSGNLSVSGTLVSGGTATGDWTPAVDGSLLGNNISRWTLNANSGNFANTLTVTGATSLQDTLTVTRTLASGNVTITGFANVSTTLQVTGNTLLSGNVSVTGQATISNTLSTGNTTITGFINVSSTANIGGDTSLRGALAVNGAVTVSNTLQLGNTTVTGFINVSSTANVGGNFNVVGLTTLAGNTTISGTLHTVAGNTSFDGGVLFVDGANNRVGINNNTPNVALEVTGAANVSVSVNSALLTVGSNFIANTTGAYHTGTVNAASFTTFATTVTGLLANTTALVPTGTSANTVLLGNTIGRFVISANSLSTAGLSVNASGMFPESNTAGTSLGNTIARWVVTANTGDFSGGITSGTIGPTSNGLIANTTAILVGNTSVNVSIVPAGITISGSTGLVPYSNTIGVNLGSDTKRWVLTANTGNFTGTVTGTVANMSTSVNSALLTVGANFIANSSGAYHTGTVNSASHTVGANFIANSSAIVGTGYANVTISVNSALLTVGTAFIANSTAIVGAGYANVTTSVNSALLTVGTNFIANSTAIVGTGYANVTTSVNSASLTVGTSFIANTTGAYHTGTINAASFSTTGLLANTTALVPTSNTILLGNTIARFVISANTVDTNIISANGATGASGQALLSGGAGSNVYWGQTGVTITSEFTNTNATRYLVLTSAAPGAQTFAGNTSRVTLGTASNTGWITFASGDRGQFNDNDVVVYLVAAGNTAIGGLVNNTTYAIRTINATSFQLLTSVGGPAVNLSSAAVTAQAGHSINGVVASSNNTISRTKLTYNPSTGTVSATEFSATSDERLKSNITTISNALNKVSLLRGVDYTYNHTSAKSIGVIAQEVEKVFPEIVTENIEGYKSVNYGVMVGVLIEAIKELKKEVDELKKAIKIN